MSTFTPVAGDNNNFAFTMSSGGSDTLANPSSTIVPGQAGSIFVTQDATVAGTLAFGTFYDFKDGGAAFSVSTGLSSVSRLDYIIRSATSIHCVGTSSYS